MTLDLFLNIFLPKITKDAGWGGRLVTCNNIPTYSMTTVITNP